MNELLIDFANAHARRNGYLLAQTFSPVAPPDQPLRHRKVFQSTNSHSVKGDVRYWMKDNTAQRCPLGNDEINGWVDVYAAYWAAIGEILAGEGGKVCG